jgi:hypothetical protein
MNDSRDDYKKLLRVKRNGGDYCRELTHIFVNVCRSKLNKQKENLTSIVLDKIDSNVGRHEI